VSLPVDDFQLAMLAHRAEFHFVGSSVGVMDQMASSLGRPGAALLIDTRALTFETVEMPVEIELAVIHSGIAHSHAAGDYGLRRTECEQACALLGVSQLRDLSEVDLGRLAALPEPLGRRTRHVVNENARVLKVVEIFRSGDLSALRQLLHESHDSLRYDYQVSIPEVDLLIDLARQDPDAQGARLTGGGFGGSILVATRAGKAAAVAQRIVREYAARSDHSALIVLPEPCSSPSPGEAMGT
jgi:galactokinase